MVSLSSELIKSLSQEREKLSFESEKLRKERDQFRKERDGLIKDIAIVRKQRDDYKDKLKKVVDLFASHINYKLAVTRNQRYISLRHKLYAILYSEKENEK